MDGLDRFTDLGPLERVHRELKSLGNAFAIFLNESNEYAFHLSLITGVILDEGQEFDEQVFDLGDVERGF
jgi:hypothetical protein